MGAASMGLSSWDALTRSPLSVGSLKLVQSWDPAWPGGPMRPVYQAIAVVGYGDACMGSRARSAPPELSTAPVAVAVAPHATVTAMPAAASWWKRIGTACVAHTSPVS